MPTLSQGFFIAGVAILAIIMLNNYGRMRKKNAPKKLVFKEKPSVRMRPKTVKSSSPTVFTGEHSPESIVKWETEIHTLGRQIIGQIDSKVVVLQAITEDALKAARHLEELIDKFEKINTTGSKIAAGIPPIESVRIADTPETTEPKPLSKAFSDAFAETSPLFPESNQLFAKSPFFSESIEPVKIEPLKKGTKSDSGIPRSPKLADDDEISSLRSIFSDDDLSETFGFGKSDNLDELFAEIPILEQGSNTVELDSVIPFHAPKRQGTTRPPLSQPISLTAQTFGRTEFSKSSTPQLSTMLGDTERKLTAAASSHADPIPAPPVAPKILKPEPKVASFSDIADKLESEIDESAKKVRMLANYGYSVKDISYQLNIPVSEIEKIMSRP